jgi:hypothetical protein
MVCFGFANDLMHLKDDGVQSRPGNSTIKISWFSSAGLLNSINIFEVPEKRIFLNQRERRLSSD